MDRIRERPSSPQVTTTVRGQGGSSLELLLSLPNPHVLSSLIEPFRPRRRHIVASHPVFLLGEPERAEDRVKMMNLLSWSGQKPKARRLARVAVVSALVLASS